MRHIIISGGGGGTVEGQALLPVLDLFLRSSAVDYWLQISSFFQSTC